MAEGQVLDALERIVMESIRITALTLSEVREGSELTLQQWRVLMVLGGSDGLRVGAIAREIGVSMPIASRIVQRLARRELVAVATDVADRRAVIVQVTPAGETLRRSIVQRRRARLRQAVEHLGPALVGDAPDVLRRVAIALQPAGRPA